MNVWIRKLNRAQQGNSPAPCGINWGHLGWHQGNLENPRWLHSHIWYVRRAERMSSAGIVDWNTDRWPLQLGSSSTGFINGSSGLPASQEVEAASPRRPVPRNWQTVTSTIFYQSKQSPSLLRFKGRGQRLHLSMGGVFKNLLSSLINW